MSKVNQDSLGDVIQSVMTSMFSQALLYNGIYYLQKHYGVKLYRVYLFLTLEKQGLVYLCAFKNDTQVSLQGHFKKHLFIVSFHNVNTMCEMNILKQIYKRFDRNYIKIIFMDINWLSGIVCRMALCLYMRAQLRDQMPSIWTTMILVQSSTALGGHMLKQTIWLQLS